MCRTGSPKADLWPFPISFRLFSDQDCSTGHRKSNRGSKPGTLGSFLKSVAAVIAYRKSPNSIFQLTHALRPKYNFIAPDFYSWQKCSNCPLFLLGLHCWSCPYLSEELWHSTAPSCKAQLWPRSRSYCRASTAHLCSQGRAHQKPPGTQPAASPCKVLQSTLITQAAWRTSPLLSQMQQMVQIVWHQIHTKKWQTANFPSPGFGKESGADTKHLPVFQAAILFLLDMWKCCHSLVSFWVFFFFPPKISVHL